MRKKIISSFQYLTQDHLESHVQLAQQACEAGVTWLQLRMKKYELNQARDIAFKVKEICEHYKVTFIINDYVAIAHDVKADGVHLGKKDMQPLTARKILGSKHIIGGTANTFEDVCRLSKEGVDYIGIGPYRFTTTKQNLSPVLELQGIKDIVNRCKENHVHTPLIAIGGITLEDVPLLLETGIYGFAISGAINKAENKTIAIQNFLRLV